MAADATSDEPVTNEPKGSKFTQQDLPAWRPILTPKWIACILFALGALFIPLGVICYVASDGVVEVSARYDDVASCTSGFFSSDVELATSQQTLGAGTTCTVTLTAPAKMTAPIYVYYELENFYANHRRYVNSRSDEQMSGDARVDDFCKPQLYDASGDEITPCGLVAWSYFNDTFALTDGSGAAIAVSETDIAWDADVDLRFGENVAPANFNDDVATRGGSGLTAASLDKDEHFIVWMRTAALSTFRKLWGRITTDIASGETITVTIANRFNSYKYGGEKRIVLSTTSWLGGKNMFLGGAYLGIGCGCWVASFVFAYFHLHPPRRRGDAVELSWNKE